MRDSFSCARFGAGCILLGLGCASVTWDWLAPLLSSFLILTEKDSCNFRAFQSGRWPHSWHSQSFLSGTDLVKVLLLMSFILKCFAGVGMRRQSLPWDSETLIMLLSLLLTALLFWGLDWKSWNSWCFSVHVVDLGQCFGALLAKVGWGKVGAAQNTVTLTRGRSTEQLSGTSGGSV